MTTYDSTEERVANLTDTKIVRMNYCKGEQTLHLFKPALKTARNAKHKGC